MRSHNLVASVLPLLTLAVSASVTCAGSFAGFIENQGQVNESVRYYSCGTRASIYFTQEGVVLDLKEEAARSGFMMASEQTISDTEESTLPTRYRGCAVWIRFGGANPSATIEARTKLATRYSYFLGSDPDGWRTDVPAFAEVIYRDLWPGIDLAYRAEGDMITYELLLSPGANVERVSFLYEGMEKLTYIDENTFLVETSVGSIADRRPGCRTAPRHRFRRLRLRQCPCPSRTSPARWRACSRIRWCARPGYRHGPPCSPRSGRP